MSTRYTVLLESFQSGEVSPLLRGRVDTQQYSQGCRTLQNFIVLPQGGITRREGTKFMTTTDTVSDTSKLIPFIYDGTHSYTLEFGNQGLRILVPDGSPDESLLDGEGGGGGVLTIGGAGGEEVTNSTFDSDLTGWDLEGSDPGNIEWLGTYDGENGMVFFDGSVDSKYIVQDLGVLDAGIYNIERRQWNSGLQVAIGTELHTNITTGNPLHTFETATDIYYQYPWDDLLVGSVWTTVNHQFTLPTATQCYAYLYEGSIDILVSKFSITKLGSELTTPYSNPALLGSQQYGDYMIVTHPDFPPYRLTRTDSDSWSFAVFNMNEGPFFDIEDEEYGGVGSTKTLSTAGGAVGATITVTASSALFATTDDDDSPNTGRLIRIRPNSSSAWGVGRIVTFTNSTTVSVQVIETIASCTNTLQWRLGSWSGTTGYPRSVAIHEQRMVFGGTAKQPMTIWGSYVGQFNNFAPDDGSANENITDLTAYTFTLDTKTREVIQWLLSRESLLIGTTAQIHIARASNLNELLTARNVVVRPAVGVGCAYVAPAVSQDDILFIHFFARQLLQIQYNFDTDRQEAINLNLLSEHITDTNPIQNLAIQNYPYRLIWMGLEDGTIGGLTNVSQIKMNSWHRHILGGSFGSGNPIVESMTNIPGENQDELWLVVKRTVNAATTRHIEVLGRALTSSATRSDGVFLDSYVRCIVTSGALIVTQNPNINDLSHLNGQTVGVMRNGVYIGTDTITAGELTTNDPANWDEDDIIHVGLPYTSIVETNTLEIPPTQRGQLSGADQRVFETIFRLHNSFGGEAGYSSTALDDLVYPDANDPDVEANTMFSGDIMMKLPHGWGRDSKVYLRQTEPYPLTLTLLINKVNSGQA